MRLEIKSLGLLFISLLAHPDSIRFNTSNNHGVTGLINIPTARFQEESSSYFTAYRGNPDRKISITMMPYDWFEASFFYTSIKDRPYGQGFDQDYKDKGFNAKFRIKEENNYPAIALGFNDIAGTGIYSSEYVVSSYGVGKIDFHLGFGWGRLNGGNQGITNPLITLSETFSSRCIDWGCDVEDRKGGTFRYKDYFSGKKVGILGGISYLIHDNWLLKAEIDPTDIPDYLGFPSRKSQLSYGFEYIKPTNLSIALTVERNEYLGLKFSWRDNYKNFKANQFKAEETKISNPYTKMVSVLNLNKVGVARISKENEKINLVLRENAYKDFENLKSNVNKSIKNFTSKYKNQSP